MDRQAEGVARGREVGHAASRVGARKKGRALSRGAGAFLQQTEA